MNTWFVVVVSSLAVVVSSSDTAGPCPAVVGKVSEVAPLAGEWLQVETTSDDGDRCVVINVVLTPPAGATRSKSGIESDGDVYNKSATLKMDKPGVLSVVEADGDREDYTVLAVEPSEFVVLYKCDFDKDDNNHEEEIEVLLRRGSLPRASELVPRAKKNIPAGTSPSLLHPVDQSRCSPAAGQ